ncbi:MAG: helix-turn-helix transcriptional regulator [Bacilli bacterium]
MAAITPLQLRLARFALGLGVRDLAAVANVSPTTITRYELGRGDIHGAILERLQRTLEGRGVVFVEADASGSATIRLKE